MINLSAEGGHFESASRGDDGCVSPGELVTPLHADGEMEHRQMHAGLPISFLLLSESLGVLCSRLHPSCEAEIRLLQRVAGHTSLCLNGLPDTPLLSSPRPRAAFEPPLAKEAHLIY